MSSSSTLQQLPLFGRKYQIDLLTSSGVAAGITATSDSFEPEALRATFRIHQRAFQIFWYADIDIYNLDEATTLQILGSSMQDLQVVVKAGYQNGAYGVIWSGPVFQPLFERVNGGLDFKITLHCVLGLQPLTRNYVNQTFAAQINQTDLVLQIAKQSFTPIPIAGNSAISTNIKTQGLPRAKTVFGNPGKYFTQIAQDNNMQWWLSSKGLEMGFPDEDIHTTPDLVFSPPQLPQPNTAGPVITSPNNGVIIGTPQQTQYGVAFRALLDPRVQVNRPLMTVKIDNSQIRKQKLLIDPSQQGPAKLTLLDADGIYIVAGVTFVGDTRGDEWYVDIDAYSTTLGKLALLQAIKGASIN